VLTAEVMVKSKVGLHARPAAMLVSEAKKHQCKVDILANGRTADAKSILTVLLLGVESGQTISVSTDGADEEVALKNLVALLEDLQEGA